MPEGKRPHRRKREDPLVAIDGARVRAAIEWKGMSVNGAAGRLSVSQQTLDSIVRGKTKRCYKSLRESLARLLDLPAAWLGGETDLPPDLTAWLPYPGLGYKPLLSVDENIRLIRPRAETDVTPRMTLPPRYQLAAYDLGKQVVQAWKRDVKNGNRAAERALSRLGIGEWKSRPWDRAMMLVARLVSAFWWRRLFLKASELPAVVDPTRFTDADWRTLSEKVMAENQRRAAEQLETGDQFAAGAAAAWSAVLRPWFEGQQQLNYKGFAKMLEWASRGFGKNPQ